MSAAGCPQPVSAAVTSAASCVCLQQVAHTPSTLLQKLESSSACLSQGTHDFSALAALYDETSACLQQGGHNPSALDFLADVANSAGNYPGDTSKGTAAAAAASAGTGPVNGILKVCPQHTCTAVLPLQY